ncbi:T9SS type A sorting domain-containing protein [Aquimarina litoralis]|uniref:T9SS type A sorting domain-containing protein n=1 Tax=Aquimarina litoralis TaxID=584605 RepID=UPI001C59B493|nr:T9SS type A sorting domain-containing protein [Aquimarina litoralis]MBW1297645.1 hypothetical protein [Aquimarina litoralis]
MIKLYVLIFIIVSSVVYAQEVTTVLDSPDAVVDDALVLDSRGNLFGSNFFGDSVYKITRSGEVSVFVSGLANPNGLAFDRQGNLFIAEFSASMIHKYDKEGNLIQSFPVDGIPSGMIQSRFRNSIIYTDVRNNGINELLSDGTVKVLYKGEPLNAPVGLAFDRRGALYIGNFNDRKIYKLNPRSEELEYIATVPDSGTDFPFLGFITYANGSLFGTVYGEHKIYEINPREIDDVSIFAGSSNGAMDGDITKATFSYPAGIVANRTGTALYVSELSGIGNIRKISKKPYFPYRSFALEILRNPVKDILNLKITSKNEGSINIMIYSLLKGDLIFESQEFIEKGAFKTQINLEGFRKGGYILKVEKNGDKRSKIFIKN